MSKLCSELNKLVKLKRTAGAPSYTVMAVGSLKVLGYVEPDGSGGWYAMVGHINYVKFLSGDRWRSKTRNEAIRVILRSILNADVATTLTFGNQKVVCLLGDNHASG